MPILRSLFWYAAQRVASDPEARAKTAKLLEHEIKPRARAAWHQTKPAIARLADRLERIAGDPGPIDTEQPRHSEAGESSNSKAFRRKLAGRLGGGRLWLWK